MKIVEYHDIKLPFCICRNILSWNGSFRVPLTERKSNRFAWKETFKVHNLLKTSRTLFQPFPTIYSIHKTCPLRRPKPRATHFSYPLLFLNPFACISELSVVIVGKRMLCHSIIHWHGAARRPQFTENFHYHYLRRLRIATIESSTADLAHWDTVLA